MTPPRPDVVSAGESAAPGPSTRTGRLRVGVGLVIGAGAIYAVVSSAGGFADSVGALTSARRGWLGAGGLAEAVSYATLGLLLRRLVGNRVNRRTGVRLGLVVSGLGNILPAAPAEGLAMAGAELRRRGVDTRRTRIALGLMQWLSIRTLFGVAALDALAVAAVASVRYPERAPGLFVLGVIALAVLGVLAATAWLASRHETMELRALAAGRVRFWQPPSPASERRAQGAAWHSEILEALGSKRTQAAFGGLALTSCLADATCFRCALVAVGVDLKPGMFLFAYVVAMITALVPLLPAGIGVVETVVPALLHHAGVPLTTALAGVLAYRALGTLLPAICGTTSLIRLRMTVIAPASGGRP
ncbi:MAG: Lysylphosphatidylglycerol synthase region [Actinomycetota bacterium]|nr:Lysylphosphatidylglycerol synthase region [Actinomycetota bacterium]